MKKFISILLSAVLAASVIAVFPASAASVSGETGECVWTYDSSSSTLTISGEGSAGNDWSVPGSQPWRQYNDSIYHIEVGDGVTYLGECFFYGMKRVNDARLADSVRYLGVGAFEGCSNLSELDLGTGMASVGSDAFLNTSLSSAKVLNTNCAIGSHAFGFRSGGGYTPVKGFTVYGYSGSTAQTYAAANGFDFVDLEADAHSVAIYGGFASYDRRDVLGEKRITGACRGETVYLLPDPDAIEDCEYYILFSREGHSDQTEVWVEGDPCFVMPDCDVEADLYYEVGTQTDYALDLYKGAAVIVTTDSSYLSSASEAFGVQQVIEKKAASASDAEVISPTGANYETSVRYDIDGDGSYDILYSNKIYSDRSVAAYSLLAGSSLTGNLTLSLDRAQSIFSPVRRLAVNVVEPRAHSITVSGGVASSSSDDFGNNYVITEAKAGETVYLFPNKSDLEGDGYVAQFSMRAESADVEIIDDAAPCFIMPDKPVTVAYYYDAYVQKHSTLDLRGVSCTVPFTEGETGARSEAYGVSMVMRLKSAAYYTEYIDELDREFYIYDIDGDGSCDVEHDPETDTYWLCKGHSLDESLGSYVLVLTREESWTLPVRSVTILLGKMPEPPKRGDVNRDGVVNIDDATFIQMHLAEFLTPNYTPLIDEEDPDSFFRADFNNDGRINIMDVTVIQRSLAGLA